MSENIIYTEDYIVESGTSEDGFWTYRKWNSGIAECWGRYSTILTDGITSQWGNTTTMYIRSVNGRIDYPFAFKEVPVEQVGIRSEGHSLFVYPASGGYGLNSNTQTACYSAARPTSTTSAINCMLDFYVVGFWK